MINIKDNSIDLILINNKENNKFNKELYIGFDNVDEIIEEINKESNVNYEAITIGGVE